MKYCVLYNPRSGSGESIKRAEQLRRQYDAVMLRDVTEIRSYAVLLEQLEAEDKLILCGGDGTLNRFVNDTADLAIGQEILYLATGSGNDFLREIAPGAAEPVSITRYLQNLPTVEARGRTMKFINGVGYGTDGYCCQVGDDQRARGKEKVNYAMIAVQGVLGGFQPRKAEVFVDGQSYRYDNVWLAPTMNGRYYGGGMIPAPEQDRLNAEGTLSVTVIHSAGKLKTLSVFPSLFQGTHVKHTEMVSVHRGKDIRVCFERPTPLQVDGETIVDVTEYHAYR